MQQNEIRDWLRAGIEAARNGNTIIARDYFRRVLDVDPENELAWLWMAQASERPADRERALERVLRINPNNERARTALRQFRAQSEPEENFGGYDSPKQATRTAQQEAVANEANNRDWFQPIDRKPKDSDLWAQNQSAGLNLFVLLAGGIAVLLIAISVYLLVGLVEEQQDTQATDEASTAQVQTSNAIVMQTATPAPPTRTPIPTSPLLLTPRVNSLPPTLAPTITDTPLPTKTPIPGPSDPSIFSILLVSNETVGAPSRLFSAFADGSGIESLELFLEGISVVATDVPSEDVTPPPTAEVTEGATEEPSNEDETPVATEAPQDAATSERIEVLDVAFSPTGEFIVFTLQRGELQELYTAQFTDNGLTRPSQLTITNATETRGAAWSPNGESILFHSNMDGDFDLYLIPAGGGNIVNLTNNDFEDRDPAWSPDGQFVAFASDRAGVGSLEIFVIPFGGAVDAPESDLNERTFSGVCQMTASQGSSFAPAWSPDGQSIAFITNRDTDNDLYIMRYDGANEQVVSYGDGRVWQERNPSWSPDGDWIAVSSNRLDDPFATDEANPTSKIWLVTPNGREWRTVTTGESNDLQAVWTPNPFDAPDLSDFNFSCASN